MEGTVRILLLTMLAIQVSARYEFNAQRVAAKEEEIDKMLDKTGEILLRNANDVVWRASRDGELEIVFNIINTAAFGDDCGGGPAITIDGGPNHCLYSVSFYAETDDNGNPLLQLGLFFRHNSDRENLRLVQSEVFKPPVNENEDNWNTLRVQPFNDAQLRRAQNGEDFSAPISWVENILDGGVYAGKNLNDRNSESQGDTEDTGTVLEYTAHPVIINENILNGILAL